MYYTVIKHDGHLRTRGKCRKHESQASGFFFYISRVFARIAGLWPWKGVFSNVRSVTVYYMTWVCSRSNACSDWLILGHYSPVMPTGRLRACKSQAKSHIISHIITSQTSARSIREGLGPRFSRKDLTLGK